MPDLTKSFFEVADSLPKSLRSSLMHMWNITVHLVYYDRVKVNKGDVGYTSNNREALSPVWSLHCRILSQLSLLSCDRPYRIVDFQIVKDTTNPSHSALDNAVICAELLTVLKFQAEITYLISEMDS